MAALGHAYLNNVTVLSCICTYCCSFKLLYLNLRLAVNKSGQMHRALCTALRYLSPGSLSEYTLSNNVNDYNENKPDWHFSTQVYIGVILFWFHANDWIQYPWGCEILLWNIVHIASTGTGVHKGGGFQTPPLHLQTFFLVMCVYKNAVPTLLPINPKVSTAEF